MKPTASGTQSHVSTPSFAASAADDACVTPPPPQQQFWVGSDENCHHQHKQVRPDPFLPLCNYIYICIYNYCLVTSRHAETFFPAEIEKWRFTALTLHKVRQKTQKKAVQEEMNDTQDDKLKREHFWQEDFPGDIGAARAFLRSYSHVPEEQIDNHLRETVRGCLEVGKGS